MVPELYLGVCNIPIPTSLTLSVSSLSVYTNVEQIHVYVTTLGAGNCTITPSLPNGLVFDSVFVFNFWYCYRDSSSNPPL